MKYRTAACLVAVACLMQACATSSPDLSGRVSALLPADFILIGEQHDADDHHALERALVLELARRGQLAALAIEMADQGRSTSGLSLDASETAVQSALDWNEAGWPWKNYGPVVMAAVHSGVTVLGANLPRAGMRAAMANEALDRRLAPANLERQRDNIREGHCKLLPESQLAPMTRIQIERDATMAATLLGARQAGKTVLLVAGGDHILRDMGVPVHLPATASTKVVLAAAGAPEEARASGADVVWETASIPPVDHCAELEKSVKPSTP
jgi:uncharacterized iron-regulated protein